MKYLLRKSDTNLFDGENADFGQQYNLNIYPSVYAPVIYREKVSSANIPRLYANSGGRKELLDEIRRELPGKEGEIVAIGLSYDPYNAFEETMEVTRGVLQLLNRYGMGVVIITQSTGIERDVDLLEKIAEHSPVLVMVRIITPQDMLSRDLEPGCGTTSERLELIRSFNRMGIPTGVVYGPLLPFVTDTFESVQRLVNAVQRVEPCGLITRFHLSLFPEDQEEYFARLSVLFPGIEERYATFYNYDGEFPSPKEAELNRELRYYAQKFNIPHQQEEIVSSYTEKYITRQMNFFQKF